jgi:hypothetical protein
MTAQDFIFKASPYKKVDGEDFNELYKELSKSGLSVNGYNPIHNVETTYHLYSHTINIGYDNFGPTNFEPKDKNIRCLSFRCGRFGDILTLVVYKNEKEGYLLKIGTYPSLRDFHKDDIKRYDKVLSNQQRTELITAIMIANNGVGIGSYVYLRRIFEGIVYEEADKAVADGVITKDDFDKKRMDEKIVSIKNYLPAFLYDHHKELYSILSMGVHQLDEEDCLGFFPVLYDCIILILEDRLAQKEKELTSKNAAASLSKIMTSIVN